MARPRSKIKEVCQNENCPYYRKEKGNNIIMRGKNIAGHQRYFCFHCNKYFVKTKGTPMYRRRMSEREVKAICKELVEKKGIRAVERTLHVHRDTVSSLLHDLANHAKEMNQHLVKDLGLSTYEVDELWTFVKKNLKGLSPTTINSLNRAKQLLQLA